jgi:hypothetical protein
MNFDLETELLDYFKKYKILEEKGGPEQDGNLFEEILDIERAILSSFGLPEALKYCKFLHQLANRKRVTLAVIKKTIEKLQQAAETYHSRPVTSSLETLKHAQQEKLSGLNVIPELGFIYHTYTVFLYDTLLLPKKATPEAILQELQTLDELELYGPVAKLKFNLAPGYSRTNDYQELKSKLQFLDLFLNADEAEAVPDELWDAPNHRVRNQEVPHNKTAEPSYLSEDTELQENFEPDYFVLTDLVFIEEIIFSRDSGVTVIGKQSWGYEPQRITLGFEFDQLTKVLKDYRQSGQKVLSYFNKTRQQNAIDEPVIINLKEKTGNELELYLHYFRVYKPQALGRNGKPELMNEAFYIVDEIIDKAKFDKGAESCIKSEINGLFHHVKNHYYTYLNAKADGMTEEEARRANGLEDNVRFELSKLLYNLEKHGGKAEIR